MGEAGSELTSKARVPGGVWLGALAGRAVVVAIRVERRIEESMVGELGWEGWGVVVVVRLFGEMLSCEVFGCD